MLRLALGVALAGAIVYIGWLQRALAQARSRGDMYRDIAAALHTRPSGAARLPSDPALHEG